MATAPTANEIKAQIKTLLTPVIGTVATRKTKIFDYMAIAFKPAEGEDPTILRSALDPVSWHPSGRINCLMITEAGFNSSPQVKDATKHDGSEKPSRVITRRFRLTYFYEFNGASETAFSEVVELIRTTIEDSPRLGFALVAADGTAGKGARVEGHDELQMPEMLPDAFGDALVHVAEGTLTVRVLKA